MNNFIAANRPGGNKGTHRCLIEEYNLVHYALSCVKQVEHDIATYVETVASVNREKWISVMQEEMQLLEKK
jgi:hypothetical protein